MEEEDDDVKLESPFIEINKKGLSQNSKTFIYLLCLNIIVIAIVTFIIINLLKEDKSLNSFKILLKDKDFIRPNINLNTEFELVETKNGMKGLLISNPYSNYSHFGLILGNGFYTDTVPGLAHFCEHMTFCGSEKYKYNSIKKLDGIKGFEHNGATNGENTIYYLKSLYGYKFEKAIDILIDAFRYPIFDEEIIKKEIQVVNSEFYDRKSTKDNIIVDLIRHLSSKETSFNGFSVGNNQTLRPNESFSLSKKLKGYHIAINRPDNIFFFYHLIKALMT